MYGNQITKPAMDHRDYPNHWTIRQKCSVIKIGSIKVKSHLQFIIHELKYLPVFVSVVKVCNIRVSWASSCSLILQISIWEPSKHWNIWQTALEVIKQLKAPFSLWSKQETVFRLSLSSWEINYTNLFCWSKMLLGKNFDKPKSRYFCDKLFNEPT